MPLIIETENLSRVFKSYKKPKGLLNSLKGFFSRQYESKIALAPTTLNIEGGQVIGLVGANGAGKTTLIKLLSGLISPSTGTSKVLGFNPNDRKNEYLKKISVLLGQKNQLWWDIAPVDSYDLLGKIYDIEAKEVDRRVEELAEIFSCTDQLQTQLRRLSLGERMKMEIIGALLHRPEVLFLDEPTIGLDIVAQNVIRNFIEQYMARYKPTIILTSHYMDDISRLSDRLLLISEGKIVYDGNVDEFTLRAETKQKLMIVLGSPTQEAMEFSGIGAISVGQKLIDLSVPAKGSGEVISRIAKFNVIQEIRIEESGFEEVIHEFLAKNVRHGKVGRGLTV
ncbi:MAG: ATP-binding cassette domain-containing protein [Pseudomonadota bacterium]|nr:ATP-binding cassette domain-containing protein [Pseudomonadota bacterium]